MDNSKQNKKIKLTRYLKNIYGTLTVITVIIMLLLLSLGVSYIVNPIKELLIALCVLIPSMFIVLLILIYLLYKRSYDIFYNTLYQNTINNYKSIRNQKRILNKYDAKDIEELEELNHAIDNIEKTNNTLFVASTKYNYDSINLEYVNKVRKTITEDSFRKNIREIIYCSQSYRNAVIKLSFDVDEAVDKSFINNIINSVHEIFNENGLLIVISKKEDGIYIYNPNIDSISYLKDQLENLLQKSTISIKTINGILLVSPKINGVIYPYSAIDDIFSDLLYSASKNEDINIYIPKRYNGSFNESLLQTTMDQNNISKILGNITSLHETSLLFKEQIEKSRNILKEYATYIGMDEGGIAFFDRERKGLVNRVSFRLKEKENPCFKEDTIFDPEIIDVLDQIKDNDSSYLFSSRKSVNNKLGKKLDVYGISSGYFYFIKNIDDTCLGVIYLLNTKNKSFVYNSYIKESLLVLCVTISYYLKIGNVHAQMDNMKIRENNLMKMANISSYTIDKNTHEIVDYTPSFKEQMPTVELGNICYQTFFGQTAPCKSCPITTKNKIIKALSKDLKAEISYSINTKMSNYVELIVRDIQDKYESHNRFDVDYLVNSYYSFVERLKALYLTKSKGYVQLLTVDNIKELIDKYGNEGYAFYIRCFTSDIINKIPQISEIFLYKDDTLAFIFPESGKLDIIDVLEKVYEFSKNDYIGEGDELRLTIGYETVKYPQEFTTVSDLMRHLEKCMMSRNMTVFPTDTIHIEENNFYRPASRKEYVLKIIEKAAAENKFIIKCQPVIKGTTKSIFGGEILIRLSDDYRNTLLNTEELIKVAGENDKLNTISDLLINYVGNLYKQYGASIFKSYGFNRISINADYNYFRQPNFIAKIAQTIEKYSLPKGFLCFEVGEQDLANHYDKFKPISENLKKYDINLISDQYTGEYLSIDRLTQIGIKEIKTHRDFVRDIDVQTEKFENVKNLLDFAKGQNVKVTIVGVENGQQSKLINNYDKDISMQGYYFHHPLDVNELIEAIRKHNN